MPAPYTPDSSGDRVSFALGVLLGIFQYLYSWWSPILESLPLETMLDLKQIISTAWFAAVGGFISFLANRIGSTIWPKRKL